MKARILFPAALLLIMIGLIITTLGYPAKARLFPLLVALPVTVLLVIDLLREFLSHGKGVSGSGKQRIPSPGMFVRYRGVAAWLAAFALIIYLLGFLAGASLYLLFYLKLHGEKWLTTLIYVLVLIILVYGVFELIFGIPMYKGIFFE